MESVLGFQEQERNDVVDSKSQSFKLVPWMSWDEWKFVRGSLFSSSLDSVAFALRRVKTLNLIGLGLLKLKFLGLVLLFIVLRVILIYFVGVRYRRGGAEGASLWRLMLLLPSLKFSRKIHFLGISYPIKSIDVFSWGKDDKNQ